jgi:hypothetical protein
MAGARKLLIAPWRYFETRHFEDLIIAEERNITDSKVDV